MSNAQAAAAALDRLLVEPLLPELGEGPLVVVPTGALHALPWGALPSLRGRPLVVAPSLSVWLGLARRPRSRRRKTALIAGPRLRHSAAEVRDIASLAPERDRAGREGSDRVSRSRRARRRGARARRVPRPFPRPTARCSRRSSSPTGRSTSTSCSACAVRRRWSCSRRATSRSPDSIRATSCSELPAALLGMGTRTIVASVVPVPDAAAKRMMLAFHRNLVAGHAPAAALARAQARAAVRGLRLPR